MVLTKTKFLVIKCLHFGLAVGLKGGKKRLRNMTGYVEVRNRNSILHQQKHELMNGRTHGRGNCSPVSVC